MSIANLLAGRHRTAPTAKSLHQSGMNAEPLVDGLQEDGAVNASTSISYLVPIAGDYVRDVKSSERFLHIFSIMV